MGSLVNETTQRHAFSPKRSKMCVVCNQEFLGASSNQKTCSEKCSRIHDNRRQRSKKSLNTSKGYSQKGKNNNLFKKKPQPQRKNWVYTKYRKDHCEVCQTRHLETKLNFVVHHRDGKPTNDDPNNLITLCHSCHKFVHNGKIVLEKV